MSQVTLPRGVLVALVAALLVCLGFAAFLAGRASVPVRPASATPAPPDDPARAAAADTSAQQAPPSQPAGFPVPPALQLSTQAQDSPGAGTPPSGAPPEATGMGVVPPLAPPPPGEAARVARYFQEMETAQASAKYWSDPQSFASSLVDGLSKGDRSGIDQLIGSTRGAYERMRGISVPSDCSEHHRRSLELVALGAALLESIATGATEGDLEAFSGFPARAQQLQAGAKDVDTLAARIKQRYGIA
jgi:hypothetical protein